MSWPLDLIESWVHTALVRVGYTDTQAQLAAQSVTWLQQRNAPGVAAMAQHIDFISAYNYSPNNGGDTDAQCPILLAEKISTMGAVSHWTDEQLAAMGSATQRNDATHCTFQSVRQPLLLLPCLAGEPGSLSWAEVALFVSDETTDFGIDYERKSLRTILVEKADATWTPGLTHPPETATQPVDSAQHLLTEIPSRELVYVKTLQHYAGTLPPREPLDGADTTDSPTPTA